MKRLLFCPTGSSDFVQVPTNVVFETSTSGRECAQVSILDDFVLEDSETFLIAISSLDTAVVILQSELTVTIQDNDRM